MVGQTTVNDAAHWASRLLWDRGSATAPTDKTVLIVSTRWVFSDVAQYQYNVIKITNNCQDLCDDRVPVLMDRLDCSQNCDIKPIKPQQIIRNCLFGCGLSLSKSL